MRTAIYAGGEFAARDKSDGFLPPLLAAVLGRIAKWRSERMAIAYLSGMSDATLRDMGITRGEIEQAVRFGRPGGSSLDRRETARA
jgi:uncharacterized protein YjiS (DUF1127 family)